MHRRIPAVLLQEVFNYCLTGIYKMALDFKLNLKMTQRMVMTPMLQQAIKLLPLARLELAQKVRQELVENPMLEEVISEENLDREPEEEYAVSKDEELQTGKENNDENPEVDWENFIQTNIDRGLSSDGLTKRPSIESTLKSEISLGEHLLWQLIMSSANEKEKAIGTEIIGNINNCGYLECSSDEIAQHFKVSVEDVEGILKLIQTFEPFGIGARNLQECLLIQAKVLLPDNKLVEKLLQNHINKLEERFFHKLSKVLNVNISEILKAVKFIKELNPKPASLYSNEKALYVVPDVTVLKKDDGYQLFLNDDGVPLLRINPFYRRILKQDNPNSSAKEYMEEKYRSALWLIRSIEQRRQTILKVAKSIVKFQKGFFENGLSHLKPLVLRNVAEDINMHESTVSRVTTLKYMLTPRGIIDFKYFFHSGIESDGVATSSVRIKDMIQRFIRKEDSSRPITDQQLVGALNKNNIKIARRTISKYRKELKIPSANKRRRLYD